METSPKLLELADALAIALASQRRDGVDDFKAALLAELEEPLSEFEDYLDAVDPTRLTKRWRPSTRAEVEAALDAWLGGRDDAFDALIATSEAESGGDPREVAEHIKDMVRTDRRRWWRPLRTRLKTATGVFSGVVAEACRLQSPARERLELARYLQGLRRERRYAHVAARVSPATPLPVQGWGLAAILARRVAVLEDPSIALSPFDPLGVAESVVLNSGGPFPNTPGGPSSVALRRALTLSWPQARTWVEQFPSASLEAPEALSQNLGLALCRQLDAEGIAQADAEANLAAPVPPEPVLAGFARDAVRLALGDRTKVGAGPATQGLADDDGSLAQAAWLWVLAVRASECGAQEKTWLTAWAQRAEALTDASAGRCVVGAAALLASEGEDELPLEVARAVPAWLELTHCRHREGLASLEFCHANRREARLLANALRAHGDSVPLISAINSRLSDMPT